MEEAGVFFCLLSRSQTQDQFMKFVIPNLTEVFVECKVLYLFYQMFIGLLMNPLHHTCSYSILALD